MSFPARYDGHYLITRFYNGGQREKAILTQCYERLAKHVHSVFKARIPYGMTEDYGESVVERG